MKIAILAARDPGAGPGTVAEEALSRVTPGTLPPGAVLLEHRGTLLKTLEAAAGFDALILIDGASMGKPPGDVTVFSLNELILPGYPPEVAFDNIDIEGDILYANKFLSLPPVRIIGIESGCGATRISGETLTGAAESCLEAIRQAVGELT